MDYNSDTWKVIDNYFNVHQNYLTKHHLDSFNDLLSQPAGISGFAVPCLNALKFFDRKLIASLLFND